MHHEAPDSDDHPLLFVHAGGSRIRRIAQVAHALAAVVLLALAVAIAWQLMAAGTDAITRPLLIAATAILGITALFLHEVGSFALSYVTRLDVWPRSNLVVIRTAGLCSESIRLVPLTEFDTANPPLLPDAKVRDPLWRVRLRSGRRLVFDSYAGEAPCGWTSLQSLFAQGFRPTQNLNSPPLDRGIRSRGGLSLNGMQSGKR